MSKAAAGLPRRAVMRAAEECRCRREVVWARRAELIITFGGLYGVSSASFGYVSSCFALKGEIGA